MMLASSRKILSYLLSAITAVVLVVAVISGINHLTIGNKNFYIKSFSTQALADECDKQLTEKYKTLSTKSNLPFDIFDSVKVKFKACVPFRLFRANAFRWRRRIFSA